MALVTATITVDFTANYSGNHRVCWRVQGSGDPYDCSTLVNCVGGGTVCSAVFTAEVNTTSCDGVITFEGYVQAACQDILSTDGRLTWTVDYTPTVVCKRYEITCTYVPINSITITNAGTNYIVGDTVELTPVGTDPNLSNAIITVSAVGTGSIDSLSTVFSAGSGYTAGDVITINLLAGSGCGYTMPATIKIDSVDNSGAVTAYSLITSGSGYICNTFAFTGGTGTGFSVSLTKGVHYNLLGSILGFTISDAGSYNSVPSIYVTSGKGTGFTGTVVLGKCSSDSEIDIDCTGVTITYPDDNSLGAVWALCSTQPPFTSPYDPGIGWVVVEQGCCIPADTKDDICFDYNITNNGPGLVYIQYTACGGNRKTAMIPDGDTITVCAILGGVTTHATQDLTIVATGNVCS